MSWRDLLKTNDVKSIISPWVGGYFVQLEARIWKIEGKLPEEFGWYSFKNEGTKARVESASDPRPDLLTRIRPGYLIGDLFAPDTISMGDLMVGKGKPIQKRFTRVHLIEPGLERFTRVTVGRLFEDGPLIFHGLEPPIGSEDDVRTAFEDEERNPRAIKGITPALDAAFQMEWFIRDEIERRRQEAEKRRQEEEERRRKEELRAQMVEKLGSGATRREVALYDFAEAAKAALTVGGAKYLDHRKSVRKHEMVVRFRMLNKRFECVCDERTLQIIDSGICLVDHETGEKGDTYFTLESLPSVIIEAENEGKLVVFRHVR